MMKKNMLSGGNINRWLSSGHLQVAELIKAIDEEIKETKHSKSPLKEQLLEKLYEFKKEQEDKVANLWKEVEFAPKYSETEAEKEIKDLMAIGKKVFELSSYEWERAYSAVRNVARENAQEVFVFDAHKGIRKFGENEIKETFSDKTTLAQAVDFFEGSLENIVLLVNNFNEGSEIASKLNLAILSQTLRGYNHKKESAANRNLILCSQTKYVPSELSEELPVVEIKLPDKEVLRWVAQMAIGSMDVDYNDVPDKVIEAALGLTTMQAEEAFKKALLEHGKLGESEISFIIKQKEAIINRSGILECMHPTVNLNDVGGFDNLKEWLDETKAAFNPEAREFGIQSPRGALLVGIPGTGKSLAAKAIASEWQLPLVKFDIGRAFGSLVGESEKNMRHALNVASCMAPCVLWVDEIEKAMSGLESSGRSDGGTTSRVVGNFLTWMQENEKEVFTIATANDISKLPPELMRKGRFDEIFFMDLPSQKEVLEILTIHLKNSVKDESKITDLLGNLSEVVTAMKGFTGAEIESVVNEGMKKAFKDSERKLKTTHLLEAIESTKPSIITQKEKIEAIRSHATDRFRFASSDSEQKKAKFDISKIPALSSMTDAALKNPPLLIGREKEIDQIVSVLLRMKKKNPLLVGPAGVGKTALVEWIAYKMAINELTPRLNGHEIYEWNLTEQSTNTMYVGQSQDKAKQVIDSIMARKNAHLFVDEIHNIQGVGKSSSSNLGLAESLKPYLARDDMSIIGATTDEEFDRFITSNPAFQRRFQEIEIGQPNAEKTLEILEGIKKKYEQHYGVTVPTEMLARIVDRCTNGKLFSPDREITLLDNAMVTAQREYEERTGNIATAEHVTLSKKNIDSAMKFTSSENEKEAS